MGETIARNMLSWLKLLINYHCYTHLVVYIIVSMMHGHTNSKFRDNIWISLKRNAVDVNTVTGAVYTEEHTK